MIGRLLREVHTIEFTVMRNYLKLCIAAGLVFLMGCQSRPPANVRPITLAVFEVIDCQTGVTPMTIKATAEKVCLAAQPIIDERDIRGAHAGRDRNGAPQLNLFITLKAGDRMKESTTRMVSDHLRGKAQGRIGVVIDGALIEAADVNGVVSDAIVISGSFGAEGPDQIADSLNAMAPPHHF